MAEAVGDGVGGGPAGSHGHVGEDNTGCVSLSENPIHHDRTKHIDVMHHFLRMLVKQRVIIPVYCPTVDQLADILTKPLAGPRFDLLRNLIKVSNIDM